MKAFETAIARGDELPSNPELETPLLDEHIAEVARLTGESRSVVHQVYGGLIAYLQAMVGKIQLAINHMKKEGRKEWRSELFRLIPSRLG